MGHALTSVVLVALLGAASPGQPQPSGATPAATAQPGARYFCPMKCEGEKTYDAAGRCPVCKMKLKPVAATSGFSLEVAKTAPQAVEPGRTTEVSLKLRPANPGDDGGVQKLAGAPIDVFVVSDDLSWLGHERALLAADGGLSLGVVFPRGGRFMFYADLGPTQSKVAPAEHSVPGGAPPDRALALDVDAKKIEDGYEVSVAAPRFKANEKSTLSFALKLNGAAPKVLGPTLSQGAKLILVSQDKGALIAVPALAGGGKGAPETAGAHGAGEVSFEVLPPKAGLYAAWVEFEHGGKVRRARFVLEAQP